MSNIRQQAENIWLKKFEQKAPGDDENLPAVLQELQIHQIELELQNQELRATQQELISAQREYFDLYNFAPVGYFSFDEQGVIVNVNLVGAQMLNRERRFLVNTVFFTHLDAETRPTFFNHLDIVFATSIPQSCQLTLPGKNKAPRYVQINSIPKTEHNRRLCHSTFVDITRLKETELALRTVVNEKEVLLKELHHRVKNNLQIVSSLLGLQAGTINDPAMVQIFRDGERRIKSMSLIHEQLYRSDNLAHIEFAAYINRLAGSIISSHQLNGQKIALRQNLEDLHFSIEIAIPCGLIINELVSNALKHAFPGGRRGEINITIKQLPTRKILLSVRDNGVGLPKDTTNPVTGQFDPSAVSSNSLGLQLVLALTRQLDAHLEITVDQGTDVRVFLNSTN